MSTTLVTRENLRPQSCGPRTTHYYKPVCAQIFLVGSQKWSLQVTVCTWLVMLLECIYVTIPLQVCDNS